MNLLQLNTIYLLVFLVLFSIPNRSNAQFMITGQLTDANDEPLPFANILLNNVADSAFIKGQTTPGNGKFQMEVDNPGKYFLQAKYLGYQTYNSPAFNLNTDSKTIHLSIALEEESIALESVEISAQRPIIIREIDRTILNIENLATAAGSSALDVLERSPGVVVNRQSSALAMLGKDGVNVMINGKVQYMPNQALFDFLDGLNADNIKSFELITTPPAKYDAQGNAGFINIVLKDDPEDGFNGSYVLSAGYGRGETGNASINFNLRKGRIALFGNYSYLRNGQEQFSNLFRRTMDAEGTQETKFDFFRNPGRNNQTIRTGLDYTINNTTIGILLSGYINLWDLEATSDMTLINIPGADTLINAEINEENDWKHLQSGLKVSHSFNSGVEISMDIDHLIFNNENPINYSYNYKNESGDMLFTENIFTAKETPFSIFAWKSDISLPLSKSDKLSIGIKGVQSTFENDVLVTEEDIIQDEFTSQSDLTENILAVYGQLDYKLSDKTAMKAGLRYEYTDSDLFSTNGGQVIDRQFGSLFPSLFISHQLNEQSKANFSYSRRINRPSFSDMAPFLIFLDPNASFGGNASLQPAISNILQADFSYKSFNLSSQYTFEDSTIVRFQNRFDFENNRQTIIPDNLKNQRTFSTTLSFPAQVNDWWSMRYFATYLWQASTSVEALGTFTFTQNNFRLNGNHNFQVPKGFSINISGFYQTRSLVGNVTFEPFGMLNFGVQKNLKGAGKITFNVTDLLNSLKRVGTTNLSDEGFFVERVFDFSQRTFKLTYSANFGNRKLKKMNNQNRTLEELKRVN